MRKLDEIGICPQCDCSLSIYKTQNFKRFVKCDMCGLSYALPKRGSINNSALICPKNNLPILIIDKKDHKAYFWTEHPCFSCVRYDKCQIIQDLISEFKELEVHGY